METPINRSTIQSDPHNAPNHRNSSNRLLELFPSCNQRIVATNPDEAHYGDSVTIETAINTDGLDAIYGWLSAQIADIADFVMPDRKPSPDRIREIASMVIDSCANYRLTEFMLFCHRFKSGNYGRFYGSFDPMTLFAALRTFDAERARAIRARNDRLAAARTRTDELRRDNARRSYALRADACADAGLNRLQFGMLYLDDMTDSEFARFIGAVSSGLVRVPSDVPGILTWLKEREIFRDRATEESINADRATSPYRIPAATLVRYFE